MKLHCTNKPLNIPVKKLCDWKVNEIITLSYENKYILARTLKHFEAILDETFFIRIHKSHILNILNGKVLDFQANNKAVVLDGGKK